MGAEQSQQPRVGYRARRHPAASGEVVDSSSDSDSKEGSEESSAQPGSSSESESGDSAEERYGRATAETEVWKLPFDIGEGPRSLGHLLSRKTQEVSIRSQVSRQVPEPSGGWSHFSADSARSRTKKALRKELEYVLKCIAWEASRSKTSLNLLCSSLEQWDLVAHELRAREFIVTNPVRTMYEDKARQILELKGRAPLPQLPGGLEGEEFLVRWLYLDPARAEQTYAQQVGTFKLFVDVSLDLASTEGQEEFYFCDEKNAQHHHYRDARLLLRVQW